MRYDDDTYLNDESDNDLWDDELELSSDGPGPADHHTRRQSYTPEQSYQTGHTGEDYRDDLVAAAADDPDNAVSNENDYYSEPERPGRSSRSRLFRKREEDYETVDEENEDNGDETDEDNDYYDSAPTPRRPKTPKPPKLDPEDPDYWIVEEESPLKEIMPGPVSKWKWMLAAAIGLVGLILFAWIWFLIPHTDNAVKYGYIKNMERRGSIIKTFEGTMIPYKELGDPDPFYFQEIKFSVESDSLAAQMKRMMLGCVPVRVEYETYHAPLPWKGEATMIIIKADTADPRKILPPEYRSKL